MTVTEAFAAVRYVVDSKGERTDVLLPVSAWRSLLLAWRQLVELFEDQEDSAVLREWLNARAAGEVDMISLDALEQEFIADGLLPG